MIGGGLMGAGIAQVGAQTGHKVTLVDVSQDVLDKSQGRINESIKRVAKKKFKDNAEEGEKFISHAIGQLSIATNPDDALSSADLVVEAVTENLSLKKKLFDSYDKVAPEKTIFASNTSSLAIADIANATPGRLDRFGGLHFFNPVPVMKLLEVKIFFFDLPYAIKKTMLFVISGYKNPRNVRCNIQCNDGLGKSHGENLRVL